jgi:5'-3' exonuclease
MIALVDGDLVAYRSAASCKEDDPLDVACHRADKLVREILEQCNADQYKLFLSGQDGFRRKLYPDYKANRDNQPRPKHLEDVRAFLIEEWKAKIVNVVEADDALGMEQTSESVICSLDKDLKMIPGKHFSWEIRGVVNGKEWVREAEFSEVSELDGLRAFYRQMLIGDRSDNIIGVDGLGKVKAGKLIDNLDDEQEMFDLVLDKYNYDYNRFLINGTCLWIMRHEGETWLDRLGHLTLNDELQQEMALLSESMKSFLSM